MAKKSITRRWITNNLAVIVLILLYVTRPAGLGEGDSALYASGVKNL
jgi:hypothetical protein